MSNDEKEMPENMIKLFKDNPELGKTMEDVKAYYTRIITENEAMKSELMASNRILWAMVQTKGGQIAIPDMIMAQANDDSNSIAASYHPEQKTTVFVSQSTKLKIVP